MIWNFKKYIEDFNCENIKVGDTIITKSNGSIIVEEIFKWGWDYNYGNLIWFREKEKIHFPILRRSFSNKDLIQRNERSEKKMTRLQ